MCALDGLAIENPPTGLGIITSFARFAQIFDFDRFQPNFQDGPGLSRPEAVMLACDFAEAIYGSDGRATLRLKAHARRVPGWRRAQDRAAEAT
jgi:hypothetical protein